MFDVLAVDQIIARSSRVVVTEVRTRAILLDEADPAGLAALRPALAVDGSDVTCMCLGDLAFDFFDAADGHQALVTMHHGTSLRWDGWPADAMLRNGMRLLQWLDSQGIPGPMRSWRAEQDRRSEELRLQAGWTAAIPPSLTVLTDEMLSTGSGSGRATTDLVDELNHRLAAAYPDIIDRILALLNWYGCGTGRTSGYPLYEGLPDDVLRRSPSTAVVAACGSPEMTPSHWRGALRYLFRGNIATVADNLARMPAATKAALLSHAARSDDPFIRDRSTRPELGNSGTA